MQLGLPLGELTTTGSASWRLPRRGKEPDESWYPRSRLFLDPPSFVIEVGHSESKAQLRMDADFWLTQTNGRTKLVLLINPNPDKSLALERWEALPNPRPAREAARAASRREFIPNKVQGLTIDSQGNVQGAPLYFPCDLIFDTRSNRLVATDLKLSDQELKEWIQSWQACSQALG